MILRPKPTVNPTVIGHRGAAGLAPENTLAAVQAGLRHGISGIEIDVSRSADGVLLLMHDSTIDKTTNGTGAVANLTWSDIRQLEAGSHFSVEFAAEPVPSLEETLELIKTDTARLFIEVKDPELYPNLERDLADIIQRHETQEQVTVISFDQTWIANFHRLAPDVPVGLLSYWPIRRPQVSEAKMVGVVWPAVFLDPTLVYRLQRAGHSVLVFTVNDPKIMRWLLWLGVDGIITDRPDLWQQAVR